MAPSWMEETLHPTQTSDANETLSGKLLQVLPEDSEESLEPNLAASFAAGFPFCHPGTSYNTQTEVYLRFLLNLGHGPPLRESIYKLSIPARRLQLKIMIYDVGYLSKEGHLDHFFNISCHRMKRHRHGLLPKWLLDILHQSLTRLQRIQYTSSRHVLASKGVRVTKSSSSPLWASPASSMSINHTKPTSENSILKVMLVNLGSSFYPTVPLVWRSYINSSSSRICQKTCFRLV